MSDEQDTSSLGLPSYEALFPLMGQNVDSIRQNMVTGKMFVQHFVRNMYVPFLSARSESVQVYSSSIFKKNPEPLNFIFECLGKIDVFEEEAKSTRSRRCEEGPRSTAAVPR